jgi:hypothetical protein
MLGLGSLSVSSPTDAGNNPRFEPVASAEIQHLSRSLREQPAAHFPQPSIVNTLHHAAIPSRECPADRPLIKLAHLSEFNTDVLLAVVAYRL